MKNSDKIKDLLAKDSVYRKTRNWPLIEIKQVDSYDKSNISSEYYTIIITRIRDDKSRVKNGMSSAEAIKNMEASYEFLTPLLRKNSGKLVAAGGLIYKSFNCSDKLQGDVDLFFHSCTETEAERILIDSITFLTEQYIDNNFKVCITRTQTVTNVAVYKEDHSMLQYQFIHRIYPKIDTILGGFDIGPAMLCYDGYKIYGTPLGFWSLNNFCLIIDLTRRSTSFEYRLIKYHNKYYCSLIFPGLSKDVNFLPEPSNDDMERILQVIKEVNCHLVKYNYYDNPDHETQKEILSSNLRKNKNHLIPEIYHFSQYINEVQRKRYNLNEQIPDHIIKKISDYYDNPIWPDFYEIAIGTMLRLGNLKRVPSILKFTSKKSSDLNIRELVKQSIKEPQIIYSIDEYSNSIKQIIENSLERRTYLSLRYWLDNKYWKIKMFGEYAPEVKEDNYKKYVEIMIDRTKKNYEKCRKLLTGINWITQEPGRQWTSSINPIIEQPKKWYGDNYESFRIIPEDVETCIRLILKSKMGRDLYSHLLQYIVYLYNEE